VTALIFVILFVLLARAVLRGRPWIRGATVTIAILQLLLAYSILISGQADAFVGWIIAVPSVALIVLVFTPPVLRATARPTRED
jgi:hypothetical protein